MTDAIAVLGAGILGASLALLLARQGRRVVLFDGNDVPVGGASRWNEGKIHLGYLYGADATLRTARHILPGSLRFGTLMAELVGTGLGPHTTSSDDLYLVHRNSLVDAATLEARFAGVDRLIHDRSDAGTYLADAGAASRRLSAAELAAVTQSDDVVAAFEVPERSVNTQWLADRLADVLRSTPAIELRLGATVCAVAPDGAGHWRVVTAAGSENFGTVVNALWHGRLSIDRTAGLELPPVWSHRYRRCLFVRTSRPVGTRSALVAVGPFGDVKNYNGRDFYISWYPVGLVAEGSAISLPPPAPLDAEGEARFIAAVRAGIAPLLPGVDDILAAAESIKVRGGFVFAQEYGSIGDPSATIHRRDRFGITRLGSYFSVDTGKYSAAPWLAEQVARQIGGAA